MSRVSFMEPDGIQKGWKNSVRKTAAMISAQNTVFTVSTIPSPLFVVSLMHMAFSLDGPAFHGGLAKPLDPNDIRLPTEGFSEPSDVDFFLFGRTEAKAD